VRTAQSRSKKITDFHIQFFSMDFTVFIYYSIFMTQALVSVCHLCCLQFPLAHFGLSGGFVVCDSYHWHCVPCCRMRKLSMENRWRQSPHHVASDTNNFRQNGNAAGGEPGGMSDGDSGSHFRRFSATELRSTLTRQLTQLREVCSRRWTELSERIAQHRGTSTAPTI
jgi:hypothetical protein